LRVNVTGEKQSFGIKAVTEIKVQILLDTYNNYYRRTMLTYRD